MDLLRPALACEALDLPGFGDSPPRPDGRYSIAALAQTVTALIEKQNRGPVHLMGNSLGGAVCVKVAATRPELIRTLTLISPALPDLRPRLDLIRFPVMGLPRLGPRLVRQYQVAMPPERRVADGHRYLLQQPRAVPAGPVRRRSGRTQPPGLPRATPRPPWWAARERSPPSSCERARRSPWRDAARITAPVLVIYGQHDRLVDPRNAGRAAHAFKNAKIVVLPRTGHVAQMERPGLVATEIGMLLGHSAGAGQAREFPLASAG